MQFKRNGDAIEKYREDIDKAALYLVDGYKANVWPETKVGWGTYKGHLGHQQADEGFGCFRCHDEEHENNSGKVISQECSLCHDEPE